MMTTAKYINLTALGAVYGVNAQDVGRWLKGIGLRDEDGRPSHRAVGEGFVQECPLAFGGSAWLWHEAKTCGALDAKCYPRGGGPPGVEVHDGFTLIRGG